MIPDRWISNRSFMSDIPPRALRETLRDQVATPSSSSGCVDVDMLAAWGEGTLSSRDRAVLESHAATCARCQAMLAAMAKTAPPLARKWWQAATVRWLVPIAVCSALAIVVWTNVPVGRQAPAVRPSERGGGRGGLSAVRPVSETQPTEVASAAPAPKAAGKLERPLPAESKPAERRAAAKQLDALSEVVTVPSLQAPAAASSTVQPAPSVAPDVAARDTLAAPSVPMTAELRSAARGRAGVAASARPEGLRTSATPLEIPSPNRNIRWRIVTGTSVERSTDGGITWQVQSTGAAVRLVAGAAPSPTTCWLVGASGVVLVSQDGQAWQRVAFPEAIDLTAVLATDGSNATVTAADGRAFSTTDGGKTWR
jgi:photosynthesis system II assembly factor YCF48-like protein/putative zinc finger protein